MTNRKQKIKELLDSLSLLKRNMAFRGINFEKRPRITPSQWGVLMLIGQRTETSVKDVASILSISSSATTHLVDGLVRSGYVVRKERVKDRRAVILALSKKTRSQVEKMKKQAARKFLKIFNILTDREFNQYCAINRKIAQSLGISK